MLANNGDSCAVGILAPKSLRGLGIRHVDLLLLVEAIVPEQRVDLELGLANR